jgi:hypothetical protein
LGCSDQISWVGQGAGRHTHGCARNISRCAETPSRGPRHDATASHTICLSPSPLPTADISEISYHPPAPPWLHERICVAPTSVRGLSTPQRRGPYPARAGAVTNHVSRADITQQLCPTPNRPRTNQMVTWRVRHTCCNCTVP